MKLRLVKTKKETKLLCPNGTAAIADQSLLIKLLTSFSTPNEFTGDEFWSNAFGSMEEVKGETLAYVDDRGVLNIVNESTFTDVVRKIEYISAIEYAELHKKGRSIVKRLCIQGRLPGAERHSTGWMIPKDTPYPSDGRANNGGHSTAQKNAKPIK